MEDQKKVLFGEDVRTGFKTAVIYDYDAKPVPIETSKATYSLDFPEKGKLNIEWIETAPQYQNKGYAPAIISALRKKYPEMLIKGGRGKHGRDVILSHPKRIYEASHFMNFVNSLQQADNDSVLEAVKAGYQVCFEGKYKVDKLYERIKEDYGPYKDPDFEIDHIHSKSSEVIAKFAIISDQPDTEKLKASVLQYARIFGFKFEELIRRSDRVMAIFKRVYIA
jgi:hypothetical protein